MKVSKAWQCEECGAIYAPGDSKHGLAVHHVLPVEDTTDPEEMERRCFDESNLQVLCYRCHKLKHEYRQGTHEERERQRAERTKEKAQTMKLEDAIDF